VERLVNNLPPILTTAAPSGPPREEGRLPLPQNSLPCPFGGGFLVGWDLLDFVFFVAAARATARPEAPWAFAAPPRPFLPCGFSSLARISFVRANGIDVVEQWLVIERPDKNAPPTHYVLATHPKNTTRKQLVRRIKQRWRIERTYEDMKGELGLDHFEGRSYRGWQHHVSTVLACYAFVVAERSRVFPPETGRAQGYNALAAAA